MSSSIYNVRPPPASPSRITSHSPGTQAYLILAGVLGAAIGHYVFGGTMDVDGILYGVDTTKGMACH